MVSIPLSYGSSLTVFGLLGARNRDSISGTIGKITATTRKSAIGPNVPSTYRQYSERSTAPVPHSVSAFGHTSVVGWSLTESKGEASLRRGDVRADRAPI